MMLSIATLNQPRRNAIGGLRLSAEKPILAAAAEQRGVAAGDLGQLLDDGVV
jgi:hypothetical protein